MDPNDVLKHMDVIPGNFMFPVAHTPKIPRILHLIWVGSKPQPDYVNERVQKWKELMPTWQVRLWTNADIHSGEFPELIVTLIGYAYIGAQKADIMRYHIIEKYGGVYIDTDSIPKRSFEDLIMHTDTEAIFCNDVDITWVFVSSGFFAAIPHHPVLKRACELCYGVLVNTPDVYLQTGPRLLGEAIATAHHEGPKYMLLHTNYIYRDNFDPSFAIHTYEGSWKKDQLPPPPS
jgi:mannosyltransferase OCH1-like enzyme